MRRLLLPAVLAISIMPWIAGCGGGGGDSTPAVTAPAPTANVNVTVNWAARTRDVDAPASALSAVFTLKGADPSGSDFAFTINRDSAPAAYKKSYSSPRLAKLGTWDLAARFYAQPDGQGAVVGKIDAQINLTADGKGIGDFATSGTVASVAVAPNQTIPVGTPADILFVAKDAAGADLALSPGSAKFQVVSGNDALSINAQGKAVGTKPGTATVNVTVDGKTSADQQVTVGYQTGVTITPSTATIFANGQIGFDVKVDGAPSLQNSVTWSVQEGDAGGSVSNGSYVAPSAPGTYHVVAASTFDATKRAVAAVTVTGPAAPNQPGIYVLDRFSGLLHMNDMSGAGWSGSPLGANSMAIGPDGKIYVAAGDRVTRVDDLSGSNPVVYRPVDSTQRFGDARGIAIGSDGKIYIADASNYRIVRIDDMSGANWTKLSPDDLPISFGPVQAVFVASDNRIYFVAGGALFRTDDMRGTGIVQSGIGNVSSVFVAPNGQIYCTNVYIGTVSRVDDMDGKNPVAFGSGTGGGTGQFGRNCAIWVAANGQIYVADPDNYRIVRMDDMTGRNWTVLGGKQGTATGQFWFPAQVIVR